MPTGSLAFNVSARPDGNLEAAYIQLSDNQVARTEEVVKAAMLVDFDSDDQLVGVEILAPVTLDSVLHAADRLEGREREAFERFVRNVVPQALVWS